MRINVRSCHKRHLSPVLIFTQPQKYNCLKTPQTC
uniref:Uncharacterized protein n=1 Tax=Anguilla anguilla TaxID=7936 RepID=A0A0E9T511_ANGAN